MCENTASTWVAPVASFSHKLMAQSPFTPYGMSDRVAVLSMLCSHPLFKLVRHVMHCH